MKGRRGAENNGERNHAIQQGIEEKGVQPLRYVFFNVFKEEKTERIRLAECIRPIWFIILK